MFQGGCLSTLLPRELCKKCCCVSIKKIPKNKCFFYRVAAALCKNTKNEYRKSKQHDEIIELLPFDNMEGPVSIQEIKYLEKNSCVSVNVYGYDKIPYSYYISEFVKKLYHVDVLLHNNHYYFVVLLQCGSSPFKFKSFSIKFRIWNNSLSSDVLYIQASISISPKYESK